MKGDIISRSKLKEDFADMSDGYPIFRADDMVSTKDIARVIDEAPTVWHPFTEEPTEEGQYLVQHFYKSWSGEIFITYEVVSSLEGLVMMIRFNEENGNRDMYYQAWQKIEPYEEEENEC